MTDRHQPYGDASGVWQSAADLTPSPGGKRVLVLGCSPLPFENQRMNYAPGTRTWQLARPLAAAGHAVCVVCSRIPGAYGEGLSEVVELARAGAVIYTLPRQVFDSGRSLPDLVEAFAPEILVGASALPSRRAAQLAGDRPLWVDLFGDPMAEAQAKAAVEGAGAGEDRGDMAYFYLTSDLLARGDAFAAVSERQRHAVIGQLGLAGRLNRATQGLELVHTLPCALWQGRDDDDDDDRPPPDDVAPGDFVVLWSGGFNTWGDVDTLFEALELAMAERPEIRFVSTGGAIVGQDEDSYGRFAVRVHASKLRDRFLLKGRLPAIEASRYLARADLGVVTEKPIYERTLGSSARMVDWLGRGLPFVCAGVSELGATLAARDCVLTYVPGDARELARRLTAAAADPGALCALGERGRAFALEHLSFERTARPLLEWVASAERLPDASVPDLRPFVEVHCRTLDARIRDLEQRLDRRERDYHQVREDLGEVHHSKAWRWWMGYLAWRQALLKPFGFLRRRR